MVLPCTGRYPFGRREPRWQESPGEVITIGAAINYDCYDIFGQYLSNFLLKRDTRLNGDSFRVMMVAIQYWRGTIFFNIFLTNWLFETREAPPMKTRWRNQNKFFSE